MCRGRAGAMAVFAVFSLFRFSFLHNKISRKAAKSQSRQNAKRMGWKSGHVVLPRQIVNLPHNRRHARQHGRSSGQVAPATHLEHQPSRRPASAFVLFGSFAVSAVCWP